MKKMISLFLCCVVLLGILAGCGTGDSPDQNTTATPETQTSVPADTTVPEVTEEAEVIPTQSPEEEAVMKILMIGQSHAQDSVWFLQSVLQAEMPDKEFLVVDVYQPLNISQHIANIKADAEVYDYIEFRNGTMTKTENFRISIALKKEQWDLIIFNEATWPQTQEYEHTDGDFAFLKNYIKENAFPGYKLAYNATWAQPVSRELYTGDNRADVPDGFRSKYELWFGGDRTRHFAQICKLIETYEETDPDFDFVFHSGTAIQYASETHGVPEADVERKYDLYRDYTHLSDFGRLIVAYQIYAQIFGLEELTEVNVDVIPAEMRATFREKPLGDIEITEAHKAAIIASVNYALKNPNKAPEQTARPTPVLEPLY